MGTFLPPILNRIKVKPNSVVKQKKFYDLLKEKGSTQDPGKVMFNFSKYVLLDCEKLPLTKGLNFSLYSLKLDNADYLVNPELFFRDINTFCVTKIWIWLKQKLRICTYHHLSSYRTYNNDVPQNLFHDEFIALNKPL